MTYSMRRLAAMIVATTLPALPAVAHTGTPLMRVAGAAGYVYTWSSAASEVTLTRPGLTVVLRPGNRRYEINDRVAYAGEAPVYENGDLSISRDVVDELVELASRTQATRAMEGTPTRTVTAPATASGKLTVSAHAATGRDAIVVDGTAPAALPVTITLVGSISRDIPDVTLNRVTVATDGSFHATVPVAPSMPRGSVVTVTVSSLPGVSPASTRLTVGAPNPGLDTVMDHSH